MSIYTTPLSFAYFFAWLFCIIFVVRGFKNERYSDFWLAGVMFLLAMEIQDYTFGFAGINMLWEEFNGFPRHFNLAFAPTVYFYLKAQTNADFRFKKSDLKHYILYGIYVAVNLAVFVQGKAAVDAFQNSDTAQYFAWAETAAIYFNYVFYFYWSLKLLKDFRSWTTTQFSDTEAIDFHWLRNFIYLIIAGEVFKNLWFLADVAFNLPFEQDWWWHLLTVGIIVYVGLSSFSQKQSKDLVFDTPQTVEKQEIDKPKSEELLQWKPKIERLFVEEKFFLQPELNLKEVSQKLKTNTSVISAAINYNFGQNFNDFVNQYRIKEFENQLLLPENKNYTRLAVAFDCGFNSKATFNRALKKFGSN